MHFQDLALAAEHQVASILSAAGWAAVMMPRGHRDIDLLVNGGDRTFAIQVKGSQTALARGARASAAATSRPMPRLDPKARIDGPPPSIRADFYVFAFATAEDVWRVSWEFVVMARHEVQAAIKVGAGGGAYLPTAAVCAPEHRNAWHKIGMSAARRDLPAT